MNCVYVIRCRGFIKVGVADAPHSRVRDLQTCCPLELTLVAFRDFGSRETAFVVEKAIHRELSSRRARGEWFRGQPQAAVRLLEVYYTEHVKLVAEQGPDYWRLDSVA
jgi:hypothetical protein